MTAEQIAIENARAFRRLVDELERNVLDLPEARESRAQYAGHKVRDQGHRARA